MSATNPQLPPVTLRVAQIVRSMDVGGIETFLLHLIPALRQKNIECELFCIEKGGNTLEQLAKQGIQVHIVGVRPVSSIRAILRLADALRNRPPFDWVHCHGRLAGKTGRLAARKVAKSIRQAIHLHAVREKMSLRQKFMERWLQKRTDAYLMVSAAVLEAERRFWTPPTDRVRIIPNGIPLSQFQLNGNSLPQIRASIRATLNIPSHAFVAGTAARFCAHKDLPTLLHGVRQWMTSNPEAHFVLAGDGPDRAKLTQLAGSLQFPTGQLHWPGFRDDLPQWLAAMDCFVISSVTESFCLALIEAFQAGLPAITTWVGGIREYVIPDKTALCFDVGHYQQLAAGLTRLQQSPNLRAELATAGREVAKRYSIDAVAAQIDELYRSSPGH